MRICPKCGTPMERREEKANIVLYVCPVCGFTETVKVTEKPKIEGIKIKIEHKGEGVIEEHKKRIEISEEELESVLEILESSEASSE